MFTSLFFYGYFEQIAKNFKYQFILRINEKVATSPDKKCFVRENLSRSSFLKVKVQWQMLFPQP